MRSTKPGVRPLVGSLVVEEQSSVIGRGDGVGLYPHSRYNGIWEQKSAWGFEFREFRDTQAVVERWRHEYRHDSDNKRAQQKQALLT